MTKTKQIRFIDNPVAARSNGRYVSMDVNVTRILESWRESLFSFEWLMPDGSIKDIESLPDHEKAKREDVEKRLADKAPLTKPVLGLGVHDNIEIGSGRAEFLTLAAHGFREIPVHVPKADEKDFKAYRGAIDS